MRILLVEDEAAIARMVERGLRPHGHEVIVATSAEDPTVFDALEAVELVLLDIRLPGASGLELLGSIRSVRPDLPVIMLTAQDDLGRKVSAFEGGADDYVTKPFAFEELLGRIGAVTRRADRQAASTLVFGDLRIDLLAHRASRGELTTDFTRREFALLELLARNPGRVLSRLQILDAVWEYDFAGESNVVDVYVGYLRQKLRAIGVDRAITTVRGSGYRFDPA